MAGALAATALATGCGDDDEKSSKPLDVTATAKPFGGPAPLKSSFVTKVKNADGNVIFRWRFDDGTISTERDPTHTFKKPGYYLVVVDARDEGGNTDRHNLLLGAVTGDEWGKARRRQITRVRVIRSQRVQNRRMSERLKELAKQTRAELEQQPGS